MRTSPTLYRQSPVLNGSALLNTVTNNNNNNDDITLKLKRRQLLPREWNNNFYTALMPKTSLTKWYGVKPCAPWGAVASHTDWNPI